jgi:hypothetical protein
MSEPPLSWRAGFDPPIYWGYGKCDAKEVALFEALATFEALLDRS